MVSSAADRWGRQLVREQAKLATALRKGDQAAAARAQKAIADLTRRLSRSRR
ncbi:hypothetical protein E4N62_46850 [Streptomyces sp. MNU76]|uniref:hypothetical protein n=1 Tax=Streptomyces sp. MNU76 TaxID=2560026 RepID=UPI001E2ED977|nr:hypothetical protein [Streptomyces sp. MNU76]MCC9712077.1 hypothetical protein [Streptomyces sp. MNU76]